MKFCAFLSALLVFFPGPLLFGDEAADKNLEKSMIGLWVRETRSKEGIPTKATTEYWWTKQWRADLTFTPGGTEAPVTLKGTWSVSDGKLTTVVTESSDEKRWPKGSRDTVAIKEVTGDKCVLAGSAGEEWICTRESDLVGVPDDQQWDANFKGSQHMLLVCEFKGGLVEQGTVFETQATIIKSYKGPGVAGQRIRYSLYSSEFGGEVKFVPGTLEFVFLREGDLTKPLVQETGGERPYSPTTVASIERYLREHPDAAKTKSPSPEK